jgi:3-deoxy-7-phosphoheptulonate synthase
MGDNAMMIILSKEATTDQVASVIARVEAEGLHAHLVNGAERAVIGVVGDIRHVNRDQFLHMSGVSGIVPISRPYKLTSREFIPHDSEFPVDGTTIGGKALLIIAGPCSVEDRTQLLETAHAVREAGARALRGGAFKPRTSPYAFQGLGEEGLALLAEAREQTGLPIVTEVMSPEQVPLVAKYADVLQIGARNMQNFALLHAAGESQHPVLLKRGISATIEEFLMAAEYILSHGNRRVILCERGIRTFETATRNTTDINAIPVLKKQTHLPVILDPSHSTGHTDYVPAIARAAIAAGADGLVIEVHNHPDQALSDGAQSLKPEQFAQLIGQIRLIAEAVGRSVPAVKPLPSAPVAVTANPIHTGAVLR